MKSKTKKLAIAGMGITLGLISLVRASAQDESPGAPPPAVMPAPPPSNFGGRATPGAGAGSNTLPGAPSAVGGNEGSAALGPKLGDYVELDDAIKSEMYGTIEFPNAELKDIIKAISTLAKKNFILDRKIENRRITIISPQPVTKQEAYNAFLSALYMNDLTVVAMGPFLKVIEAKSALQSNIRVFHGDYAPNSEEIVTVLYPLKYLNADEIQRFLTDLVPRNARISSYPNTNTLVMTDTGLNLRRVVSVLKSIDIPGHEDQLENIPIRYASAKGIAALIDDILEAQSPSRRTGPARSQPQKTRGGGIITKLVPDERTNSLVVLANGRGVQELRNLVAKLDTADAAGGGNIHVYFCQNAVAEELSTTISSLISGAKSSSSAGGGAAPGIPNPLPGGSPSRKSGDDGVKFEGNVKITADKATNSLVVVASGSDFSALKNILKKLDIPRRQVYVEATIMEIKVGDSKEFAAGVNIAAKGIGQVGGFIPSAGFPKLAELASTPGGVTGLVAGITSGKKVTVTTAAGDIDISTVTGLIHALQDSDQATILHQPQILTSDNQEAEIKVDNKIPVASGSTTQTTGASSSTISRETVTVSLKITPQLGRNNDLIKLKVDQTIDDFSKDNGFREGPQISTTTRKANTTVVVRDGDTVVVGGLQRENSIDSRSKFPLLGDLPIIGWFFKGSASSVVKSNLILFLTPHIINEYADLMRITEGKLEEREQFGKTLFDPSDRAAEKIAKMRSKIKDDSKRSVPKSAGFKPADESNDDDDAVDAGDGADEVEKMETEKKESKSNESEGTSSSRYIAPDQDSSKTSATSASQAAAQNPNSTPTDEMQISEPPPLEVKVPDALSGSGAR